MFSPQQPLGGSRGPGRWTLALLGGDPKRQKLLKQLVYWSNIFAVSCTGCKVMKDLTLALKSAPHGQCQMDKIVRGGLVSCRLSSVGARNSTRKIAGQRRNVVAYVAFAPVDPIDWFVLYAHVLLCTHMPHRYAAREKVYDSATCSTT